MNFLYEFGAAQQSSAPSSSSLSTSSSSTSTLSNSSTRTYKMLETYDNDSCLIRQTKSPFETTTSASNDYTSSNTNFDCLINDVDGVNVDTINSDPKCDQHGNDLESGMHRYPNDHRHAALLMQQHQTANQLMYGANNTCGVSNQGYMLDQSSLTQMTQLTNDNLPQKRFQRQNSGLSTSNVKFSNDFQNTINKFQYILMAPTSPAVKINEDTLTYLNQGQNYELRLTRSDMPSPILNNTTNSLNQLNNDDSGYIQDRRTLEDIKPLIIDGKPATETVLSQTDTNGLNIDNNQKMTLNELNENSLVYMSIIRLCFWDRKLQEIEQDEIKEWEKEYGNIRMLEIDNSSTYGALDVRQFDLYTNTAEVIWNGKTGASIFFRCNCTSTAFAPHKHGGEKGIHMRFQIDTFELYLSNLSPNTSASNHMLMAYPSNNLTINCNNNDYVHSSATPVGGQCSILSPPNSSSSPLLSNTSNINNNNNSSNKYSGKDDLDGSTSDYQQQNHSQQQVQSTPSSPITDYQNQSNIFNNISSWRHVCSSYCRVQLFRLKGAQRKLKTDRSKIERLNPPDLRKRYQPSNKITLLYNCTFDNLYSLTPFSRDADRKSNPLTSNTNIPNHSNHNYYNSNIQNNHHQTAPEATLLSSSSSSSIDQYMHHGIMSTQPTTLLNSSTPQLHSYGNSQQTSSMMLYNPVQTDMYQHALNDTSYSQGSNTQMQTPSDERATFYLDQSQSTNNSYSNNLIINCKSVPPSGSGSSCDTLLTDLNQNSMCDVVNGHHGIDSDPNLMYSNSSNRLKRTSSINTINQANSVLSTSTLSGYPAVSTPYNSHQQVLNPVNNSLNSITSISTPNSAAYLPKAKVQRTMTNVSVHSTSSSQFYNSNAYNQSSSSSTSSSSSSSSSSPSSPMSPMKDNFNNTIDRSVTAYVDSNTSQPLLNGTSSLPHDCNNKYVQEWLVMHRFFHLLHLFNNYTSNDILRLSKEDMINLCGAPDGIRCYNLAHNIQIKPKLTIFITFQSQTYFSAIFLADWKSKFLINKIFSLYSTYVKSIPASATTTTNGQITTSPSNNSTTNSTSANTDSSDIDKQKNTDNESLTDIQNQPDEDLERIMNDKNHQILFERMQKYPYDYELFLRVKGILVKTTDEVLNNLQDQSRFSVEFELPDTSSNTGSSNTKLKNTIKIIMIPLD